MLFDIYGLDRAEIIFYQEVDGGGYDLFLDNSIETANELHLLSVDEAIDIIIKQSTAWRKNGVEKILPNNQKGADTKQTDIMQLSKDMFPKHLKHELRFTVQKINV